jgi:hypothetical protein
MDRAAKRLALTEALQEFLASADPAHHTFDLPDHIVAAMIELEDLSDEPSNTDDSTGLVHAPVQPRPHLNSGTATLPEPEEE